MKTGLKYELFLTSTMPWIFFILCSGLANMAIENADVETYRLLMLSTLSSIMVVLPFMIYAACMRFYWVGRHDQLEEDHDKV